MRELPHRKYPCAECPFRRDTQPGQFPPERYEALRSTVGGPGREADMRAPIFACHKSPEGSEEACAGWLATLGVEHLGIRYAIVTDRLPSSCLRPGEGWPELFDTYEEMAETQGVE